MLAKSLKEEGIRYEHFPELGGRRKPRKDSRNTAWRNHTFRGYADYMETREFVAGIARLEEGTQREGAAAIMCAEAVWWNCHRSLIADYLSPNDHSRQNNGVPTSLGACRPKPWIRVGSAGTRTRNQRLKRA